MCLLPGNNGMETEIANDTLHGVKFDNDSWFIDLQKLSNDELMRIYNTIVTNGYEFAKNAWYIPLAGDKRCPIMVAKGYKAPDTPEKMVEFQATAKMLEQEYQKFIDAWDFGYITTDDIKNAILTIIELRNIVEPTH